MNTSAESLSLTNTLLSAVRLQRHLGARIIVSTQEPTISPSLLDLSSVTIVHRFTSPEWLHSLKGHLAAAAYDIVDPKMEFAGGSVDLAKAKDSAKTIFTEIVGLSVGEALLFAPSAIVGLDGADGTKLGLKRLGAGFLKIRVRSRLTTDGGTSIMAT
jgi:hypothetical protein